MTFLFFTPRTQLVRQMVRMGLLGSARELKAAKKPRERKTPKHVWPEELSQELRSLFEKHNVAVEREGGEVGEETVAEESASAEPVEGADEPIEKVAKSSADPLDVIDKVMRDLSDGSRSRKEVLTQLASMDLIQDPNAYRKKGARYIEYWRQVIT